METAGGELKNRLAVPGLAGAAGACIVASLFPAAPDTILKLSALALLLAAAVAAWRGPQGSDAPLEAVLEAEARQRAIIDGAGEAILVIDERATILTFNRAAERMFGYGAEEMIGTSLERLMTEGGRRAHAAYLAANGVTAMVEAARLRSVHKGVRKRGDVFPFELTMTEWQDGGRRLFTGVMRDVTDHERNADALRESEARFVGLFENSAHPLFIFALSGGGEFVLETMNEAAERFAGLSRYAAGGRTPEALAGADARELKRALLECLSTAVAVRGAIRFAGENDPAALPLTFTPMRSASGEIRAVLATGDVTAVA
ncbi:PAS domain-containing protein [Sphingomonas parva]|nr:PAS domain S-box protein [Sphingomonas parva]